MLHHATPTRLLARVARMTAITLVSVLAAGRALAAPACAVTAGDAVAVANARATVHAACDCAGASSAATWRRCVRDTLAPLVTGGTLSTVCQRAVLKLETRATCGKPQQDVCCQTSRFGLTKPRLVREGRCNAPRGGSSCVSESSYLDDACTPDGCVSSPPTSSCGNGIVDDADEDCDPPNGTSCDAQCHLCLPDGCPANTPCGNGSLDAGESCDPPNGTTCSSTCTSCAAASGGEILIGCASSGNTVEASAIASGLLVAYNDTTPAGLARVVARRLGNDGSVSDATPLTVSGNLPSTSAIGGYAEAATTDGTDFYVGWSTYADYFSYFGGRRIPSSGPIASAPEVIASNLPIGFCRVSMASPLNLAPALTGSSFLPTWRNLYTCGADILFETLSGVGNFFAVPPPGNSSAGPAPIARGANDVAAIWWNGFVSSVSPPVIEKFLAASWIQPGTPTMIPLSFGFSPVPPALAALGDTFVAAWANGNEVRALRFTRAAGPLDPNGGLLLATGSGAVGQVVAASNGSTVIVAWSESTGPDQRAIRAIHLAADGTIPDPSPIAVATSTGSAAISVAANSSATLVAFTRAEPNGNAVRAVRLAP